MASAYYTVVSDLGTKKIMEAVREGQKVNITYFAVGDGGGSTYNPEAGMTELKNEVWRGDVNACYASEDSGNVLIIESVIPSDVGGFTIREMGLFDEDNTLIAICNTPDTQKVRASDGVVHELDLKMEIALSNAENIEFIIDPNIVTATKKDVEDLHDKIKNAINKNETISTLVAGEMSITCTLEGLSNNSSISVYADVPGVGYTDIVVDGDNVTVTFEEQKQDIQVKVVVADGMV